MEQTSVKPRYKLVNSNGLEFGVNMVPSMLNVSTKVRSSVFVWYAVIKFKKKCLASSQKLTHNLKNS